MMTLLDTVKNLHDEFYFHTFENGAAILNKQAAEDFRKKHKQLVEAIEDVISAGQKCEGWDD